jgi:rubrerythrin
MKMMRPSALKRLKDTYKGDDRVLPSMQRHVMRALAIEESTRRHDVMHPSEMAKKDWCGRHDYYRIISTPSEKDTALANPSFTMNNIFAEGHTIHGKYQDWLWEMGVLYGHWLCLSCDYNWNGTSPRECPECGSPRLMYREVPLYRDLVGGHADGAIHLDGWNGLIEIKSIGMGTLRHEAPRMHQRYLDGETLENIWWKISRPFATHIKQAQLYLWMAWPRYEEICFIYESKFHQQVKEFVIGYNPTMIAPILETARDVSRGVAQGVPPPRPEWAAQPDSRICKSCPYRTSCWGGVVSHGGSTEADDPPPVTRVLRAKPDKRRRALRPA